ncbi:unnamed protein product [Orchesella dallaii]|uniref:Hyaluronan-mediated motility receptor C-terminal domain-containing protein n=1 Tax=Orchesella dallaii TaxID=48710 RepID=A0ABP1QKF8_9HEXA
MFNKAAIKRFNEESSCAPPPTKYDPKLPHGSKEINFGHYSGRPDPTIKKDGAFAYPGTPGPQRSRQGRTLIAGSASARSCSDSRVRLRSRSRSSSSSSLHDAECATPKAKVVNAAETRNSANDEIRNLQSRIDNLEIERANLFNQLTVMRDTISTTEETMKILEADKQSILASAEENAAKYKDLLQTLEKEQLNLQEEISAMKRSLTLAEESVKTLESEKNSLLATAEETNEKYERLEAEQITTQNEIAALQVTLNTTENNLKTLEAEKESLMASSKDSAAMYLSRVQTLEQEQSSLKNEIETLKNTLNATEENVNFLKSAKESLLASNEEHFSKYESLQETYGREKASFETEISEMKAKFSATEEQVKKLEAERQSLVSRAEDSTAMYQRRIQVLEEELTTLKTEMEAMRFALAASEENVNGLESQQQLLIASNEEKITTYQTLLETSTKEQACLETEITVLRKKLNETEENMKALDNEKQSLLGSAADSKAKCQTLLQSLENEQRKVSELQPMKFEKEVLEKRLREVLVENTSLKGSLDYYENKYSELDSNIGQMSEKLAQTDAEKTCLEQQLSTLQSQLQNSILVAEENATKFRSCEMEMETISAALKNAEDALKIQESTKADLVAQMEEINVELVTLKNSHVELQHEQTSLTTQLQDSTVAIQALEAERQYLSSELHASQQKLEELEDIQKQKLDLEISLNDVSAENESLIKHIQSSESKISVCDAKIEEMAMMLVRVETEKSELEQKLSAVNKDLNKSSLLAEQNATKYETLQVENEFILQTLNKTELAFTTSECERVELRGTLKDTMDELEMLRNTHLELQQNHMVLTSELQNSSVIIQQLKSCQESLSSELDAVKHNLEEARTGYKQEKEDMETQLQSLKDDNGTLTLKLGNSDSKICQLDADLEELSMKLAQMEIEKSDIHQQLCNARHELTNTIHAAEEMASKYQSLQIENEAITVTLRTTEEMLTLTETAKSELVNQIKEKHCEVEMAWNALEELQQRSTVESQKSAGTIQELEVNLRSLSLDLEASQKKLVLETQCFVQQKDHLEGQLRSLHVENGRLTERLGHAESTVSQLNETISEMSFKLTQIEAVKVDLEQQLSDIRNELRNSMLVAKQNDSLYQSLKVENESITASMRTTEESLKTSESEKIDLMVNVKALADKLEQLKNAYMKLQQHNVSLKTEQQKSKAIIQQHEADSRSLHAELEATQEKLAETESFKQQKDDIEARLRDVLVENKSLKEQLEHYESVYTDYATLVGHHNNRQKIQHVIKIKDENLKLRSENDVLRQKVVQLQERLKHAPSDAARKRFDPSQAFKVLKEPFVQDDKDIRGPESRSTFTVSKRAQPTPTIHLNSSKKESKQGMAFDVCFDVNKENNGV